MVLGSKAYKGEKYNPCLVERVKRGVALANQGLADTVIFSGGNDGENGPNEAETMTKIAKEQGLAEKTILIEKTSTSTYENLLRSKKILDEENLRSIIIVSEPFHLARAHLIAEKLGVSHSLSAASTSVCWQRWKYLSRYFLKAPLAIMWYGITGKL